MRLAGTVHPRPTRLEVLHEGRMAQGKAPLQPESLPGFLSALGWGEEKRAAIGSHRQSTVNDAFVFVRIRSCRGDSVK